MKRINKSNPPNALTEFAVENPTEVWEPSFRDHDAGNSYKSVKHLMLQDQGGLCGYCEKKIQDMPEHHQRIEHYHNKSDVSNPNVNWGLDWNNVFAVCLGGSSQNEEDKKRYPLPKNLSCDAYKEHLVGKGELPQACEGYYLNPLRIITTVGLFDFDKSNGQLHVNKAACANLADIDNRHTSLEKLVEETIRVLNLNCDRLCGDRLEVLKSYNKEIARARKANDRQGLTKLAERWFRNQWPSFFTTRRILLGKNAETYLSQISYNG